MQTTKDLWLAGFLQSKGYTVINYSILDPKKKLAEFNFNISDEDWKTLKLEFYNSEVSKVKWNIEKLKDLCY